MESKARCNSLFIVRLIGKPLHTFPDALGPHSLRGSTSFVLRKAGPTRASRRILSKAASAASPTVPE